VVSLSFHEAAHAWTANRLGDPTAKQLGRLTLNPLAHIDWIGTVAFPLIAMLSNLPLIGWAKPVPVNMHHLREPRRDFAIVALAGPVSNLILASGAILPRGRSSRNRPAHAWRWIFAIMVVRTRCWSQRVPCRRSPGQRAHGPRAGTRRRGHLSGCDPYDLIIYV
jgi:Zn-dependent protease